jgi:hypothetical protein
VLVRQLLEEGRAIEPEDLAHISPYLTEHINRFGEYSTHELGLQPEAYDLGTAPQPVSSRQCPAIRPPVCRVGSIRAVITRE